MLNIFEKRTFYCHRITSDLKNKKNHLYVYVLEIFFFPKKHKI